MRAYSFDAYGICGGFPFEPRNFISVPNKYENFNFILEKIFMDYIIRKLTFYKK